MELIEKTTTINVADALVALEQSVLESKSDADWEKSHYLAFVLDKVFLEGVNELFFKQMIKNFLSDPDNTYWLSERVNVYKVRYASSLDGEELTGVVLIPGGTNASLPVMSFQHGTAILKRYTPSLLDFSNPMSIPCYFEAMVGVIFAAKGNIVLMPDYPGMGIAGAEDKNSVQPYMCAKPLACSVADLIQEVIHDFDGHKVISETDFVWNQDLFLVGYSQGGYVTMATVREIQENPDYSGLNITASAPMAGPYSLSKTMRELMLREERFDNIYFLPLAIRGFYASYGDDVLNNVLNAKNAFCDLFTTDFEYAGETFANMYDLMDKANDPDKSADFVNDAINYVMEKNGYKYPRDILSAELIKQLENQDRDQSENQQKNVYEILLENDVSKGWKPFAPMYLYHCPNDDVVPFENSLIAMANFKAAKADVSLIPMFDLPVDEMVHALAYPGCVFGAFEWFETLKNEAQVQLSLGGYILPGQVLKSDKYHFRYQLDGDLSMYETQTMQLKWQIITPLEKGGKFLLNKQTKALELYDGKNRLVWQMDTNGEGNFAEVSESGELIVCDRNGVTVKTLDENIGIQFDAAFRAPNGKVYIFMGDEFLRYSDSDCNEIDEGYPKPIQGNWGNIGNFNKGIDAAFTAPNGKTYLFKENQYVRYSDANCTTVDNGFPRNMQGNWGNIGDFNKGIDAAFTAPNGKTYLFKGSQYVRYSDSGCDEIDEGYPKSVKGNWGLY